MRDLKLSQSYSIIALNAQDSINMTTIKKYHSIVLQHLLF